MISHPVDATFPDESTSATLVLPPVLLNYTRYASQPHSSLLIGFGVGALFCEVEDNLTEISPSIPTDGIKLLDSYKLKLDS